MARFCLFQAEHPEHLEQRGFLASPPPGTSAALSARKSSLFQVFHVFQVEHDEFAVAERAAIAVQDGKIPPAYADAWAVFQVRKPGHVSAAAWFQAVDNAGRFLDEWAGLALDFGWRPSDIFGSDGLAWFCAGERVRSLGPDNAITAFGRIFTRFTGRSLPRGTGNTAEGHAGAGAIIHWPGQLGWAEAPQDAQV